LLVPDLQLPTQDLNFSGETWMKVLEIAIEKSQVWVEARSDHEAERRATFVIPPISTARIRTPEGQGRMSREFHPLEEDPMSAMLTQPRAGANEKELWRRLKQGRDQRAREELVNLYMPVAKRMAGRYAGVVEPYDDLVQVASLGLLNAIDRFDSDRGTPFIGFAKPTIMGELKRYFRDKVWTIRVPRALHDRMAAIETATEELTEELSRPPSPKQIADHLDIDVADILEALEARENRRPLALDRPVQNSDGEEPSAPEWIGEVDGGYELVEDRLTMESVLPSLDAREREVLRLRFIEDLPQSKIAAQIGCSQMHVSRLLRSTLLRMRQQTAETGDGFDEAA
jgi:RNA polymerase sigma-B factor